MQKRHVRCVRIPLLKSKSTKVKNGSDKSRFEGALKRDTPTYARRRRSSGPPLTVGRTLPFKILATGLYYQGPKCKSVANQENVFCNGVVV